MSVVPVSVSGGAQHDHGRCRRGLAAERTHAALYADDTAISTGTAECGQQILHKIQEVAAYSNLSLNYKKCELLRSQLAASSQESDSKRLLRPSTSGSFFVLTRRARQTSPPGSPRPESASRHTTRSGGTQALARPGSYGSATRSLCRCLPMAWSQRRSPRQTFTGLRPFTHSHFARSSGSKPPSTPTCSPTIPMHKPRQSAHSPTSPPHTPHAQGTVKVVWSCFESKSEQPGKELRFYGGCCV